MWVRRACYRAIWVAAFVLPIWVFLGRAFFGAPLGYQVLAQVILVPLLFVGQVVATLLVFLRPSVRRSKAVSSLDALAFGLLWLGQLATGFFLVDSAASDPARSAFTALVGAGSLSLSTTLSAAAIVLTLVALVGLIVLAVREALRDARSALQEARASVDQVIERSGMAGGQPGWASDPKNTIRISPPA